MKKSELLEKRIDLCNQYLEIAYAQSINAHFSDEEIPDIEITGALSNNIEVNAKGVNKGRGLMILGELLGIHREEIMAVGDGSNDIAMLREAGLGVAMENATEAVKAAADVVTLSNDQEGAAAAIEKYVLQALRKNA